jgi:hypothetical protein
MMRRCAQAIAVIAILMMAAPYARSEEKVVEVMGTSPFSREDAVRQAQRSAVEEAVGVFIHSESEVENFELKKDKIISRTQGYITRLTVLGARKNGDLHEVTIQATVSLDKIKDDLVAMKILLESMERPTLMVLVEEDRQDMGPVGMSAAATKMTALLGDKGFDVVDEAQSERARQLDQGRQALAGNTAAATMLGLNAGAQYVIVGRAVAHDAGEAYPGTGMKSIHASLQLMVVQTQTGLVLGSVVTNGVSAHVSPLTGADRALEQCARKAVDEYVVDAITHSFQDYLNNGAPLKVHVTGVTSFRTYKLIASEIETIDRVVSSKKEGWNKASGLLVLDLRFRGTSEELAELLDARELGANTLEVVDFAPERVECNLL